MEVVPKGSIMAKYMVATNINIKVIVFQPCILENVDIKILHCHRGNLMFESGSAPWMIAKVVAIAIGDALP
jgi:hypothetical protein